MNKTLTFKFSRSIFICSIFLLFTALCIGTIFSTNAQADTDNYGEHVPGELIVCVETDPLFSQADNSSSALNQIDNQMNSFLASYDCETLLCITGSDVVYNAVANDTSMITVNDMSDSKTKPAQSRYVKIKFDERQKSINQMIKELESLSIVKYAEPNYISQTCEDDTPDLTSFQYAYDSEGQGQTHNKAGMNVPNWNSTTPNVPENDKVVVAVIDTGVDYNHPDIITADKVYGDLKAITGKGGEHGYWAGADASKGEEDTDPMDKEGHGTHVSGSIASKWNSTGTSGGASVCSILPVKAASSSGGFASESLIRAFGYVLLAKENNINVVAANNSWGGPIASLAISDLVTKGGEKGIVSIFGSGNDRRDNDTNPNSSATLQNNPYAIIVNSSNELGHPSTFSNYGYKSTDVYAPGQNIYSTMPTGTDKSGKSFKTSDIRYMDKDQGDYVVKDDFEEEATSWNFKYYTDEACSQELTAVGDGQGYQGGKALYLQDHQTASPKTIYVTGAYDKIQNYKNLAILFKQVSKCQYSDKTQCGIKDLNNPGAGLISFTGVSSVSSGQSYFPLSVPVSAITNKDGEFKISIVICYFDDENNTSSTDSYIDKISVTDKENPYAIESGTSMAAPACSGVVAVLAANNNTEPAEKIAARIKGGTNHKSWLEGNCYSGGIVDLGRANSANADVDLDPVVVDAQLISATDNSSTIKLSGYFLGDANSSVTINGIPATNIVVSEEKGRQVFTCSVSSKIAGSVAVYVNKNGKSLTRFFDVGNNSDELLERINLPDPNNDEFKDFYAAEIIDLKYASNNYLYLTANGSDSIAFVYDINNQQWRKYDYIQEVMKAFTEKGKNPIYIAYLAAGDDFVLFSCLENDSIPGFGYYNLATGETSVELIDLTVIPKFGYLDQQVMYFGSVDIDKNKWICSYNVESKEFYQISTVDDWGTYPIMYKIDDEKFLLIDIGGQIPQTSTFKNDMYLLTIGQQQNGKTASIVKLDQEAYPTLLTDKKPKEITGHAVVGGKLMMIGPSNVDKKTQGVITDTFMRDIYTKEEVAVPGLLSNSKAFQAVSAGTGDYVYTYFVDAKGPAIAKRHVGSPVPPTPQPDVFGQSTSAATGDNTFSFIFSWLLR